MGSAFLAGSAMVGGLDGGRQFFFVFLIGGIGLCCSLRNDND